MSKSYISNLSQIAKASAVEQVSVPVFICDDSFTVCYKNHRARGESLPLAEGASVLPFLSDTAVRKISEWKPAAFAEKLTHTLFEYGTVITVGQVCNERYFSIILISRLTFSKYPDAWYMAKAYDNIRNCIDTLLESPKNTAAYAERRISQLMRLCCYTGAAGIFGTIKVLSYNNSPYIAQMVNMLEETCSELLASIGSSLEVSYEITSPMVTKYHKEFQMLAVTVLVAAISISSDGLIKLTCSQPEDNPSSAEITVSLNVDKRHFGNIRNYDDLLSLPFPVALELAALKDAAAGANIPIACTSDGSRLSISFRVETVIYGNRVIFHSDSSTARMHQTMRQLLNDLYELNFRDAANK